MHLLSVNEDRNKRFCVCGGGFCRWAANQPLYLATLDTGDLCLRTEQDWLNGQHIEKLYHNFSQNTIILSLWYDNPTFPTWQRCHQQSYSAALLLHCRHVRCLLMIPVWLLLHLWHMMPFSDWLNVYPMTSSCSFCCAGWYSLKIQSKGTRLTLHIKEENRLDGWPGWFHTTDQWICSLHLPHV